MEKVTTKLDIKKNGKIAGEKTVFAGWKFDSDEREALEYILKEKFDSKQIDTFLIMLEFICFQMKAWNEELLSNKEIKRYAKPIFNSLKKTSDYLRLLEEEQLTKEIPFGYPNYLGSDSTAKDNRHRNTLVRKISKSAEASRISLEELKALIESQLLEWENPPNRPEADSHSFYHDMAMRYFQIFNEIPDKKKDGIFHQIVVEVLSILNLPSDDPSRKVDQAIDKFKKTKGYII
tara:strand:- start:24 stop:725 length:702 start_codon:yes stop_codon:yes gene_type:complete